MKSRRHKNRALRSAVVETLEQRRMLCSLVHPLAAHVVDGMLPQYDSGVRTLPAQGGIVWANRGSTDNFASSYGAKAEAARQVVDAALYYWNKVIGSFNQAGGDSQIDITIIAMARGTGQGGSGGVDTLTGNKPRTSSINLGGGSDVNGNGTVEDAEGYYLDPTPYDYVEFQGNIVNATTGEATAGSPAANGNDLFSLVTIEIQHALGIEDRYANLAWKQNTNNYLRPRAQATPPRKKRHCRYARQALLPQRSRNRALFTSNNGGAG